MAVKPPNRAQHLKLRGLIQERNQLNQQIRALYDKVRQLDRKIAEERLALRKRA